MTCSFEGCDRPKRWAGYCNTHAVQVKKGRELTPIQSRTKLPPVCVFDGCEAKAVAVSLCGGHYMQLKAGKTLRPIARNPVVKCALPTCENTGRFTKGACSAHTYLHVYNLTPNRITELFTDPSCGICGTTDSGIRNFHIDHDHACCPTYRRCCGMCVRGLLCSDCNTGIGHLREDTGILKSAISYLEKWRPAA